MLNLARIGVLYELSLGHAGNQPSSKSLVVVLCVSPANAKCRIAVRVLMTRRFSLVPLVASDIRVIQASAAAATLNLRLGKRHQVFFFRVQAAEGLRRLNSLCTDCYLAVQVCVENGIHAEEYRFSRPRL